MPAIVYQDETHRRYETQTAIQNGKEIRFALCADLVEGRWEHHITYVKRAKNEAT